MIVHGTGEETGKFWEPDTFLEMGNNIWIKNVVLRGVVIKITQIR